MTSSDEKGYDITRETVDPMRLAEGLKVVFANPDDGYQPDREAAKKYLVVGEVYTVADFSIGGGHSTIWLEERPGRGFNSVLFIEDTP